METNNSFLLSQNSIDCELKFCFEDDILADHTPNCTTKGTLSFPSSATDFPIISLSKPANCVVTRDSAKAELTYAKSTEYHEKEHNLDRFVDQVFDINYDITVTNSNLVSKLSDLQLENMSLLEKIAKMKVYHFRETEDLKDALRKAKYENYEMSQTNTDLSLSNVDYRKQIIRMRNENCHLKNVKLGRIEINPDCNENESRKIECLVAVNNDLGSKLKNINNKPKKLKDENKSEEGNSDSFFRQQLYIKLLENESVTLKDKVEELEASYESASRKSLLARIQELKELQRQLNKDTDFIRKAQYLQIENENYLSELDGLRREYDKLREKFIVQQRKRDKDSEIGSHSRGSNNSLNTNSEISSHIRGSTNSLSEISTSSEFTNGIFDRTALSPQTATTEKHSRWRRFYRTGSLSSWSWSSKFHKTSRLSHSLEVCI